MRDEGAAFLRAGLTTTISCAGFAAVFLTLVARGFFSAAVVFLAGVFFLGSAEDFFAAAFVVFTVLVVLVGLVLFVAFVD
ncbi:MAG: hypothetical protein V2A74_08440, partial [bacterium]